VTWNFVFEISFMSRFQVDIEIVDISFDIKNLAVSLSRYCKVQLSQIIINIRREISVEIIDIN